MPSGLTADNPFALMTDPEAVWEAIHHSDQLRRLNHRRCHPLDRAVIRSASAELAAFDAKIDRTTIYLPPDEDRRSGASRAWRGGPLG